MTSTLKSHPDTDILESYSFGRLSGSELDNVEDHLFVCEQCQEDLTRIDAYIGEMKAACRATRHLREAEPVHRLPRLFQIPRPAMAGAFAAILVALALPFARQTGAPATQALVQMETYRGAGRTSAAQAAANRPLFLSFSAVSQPEPCRVEIVNRKGTLVWSGPARRTEAGLSAETGAALGHGLYWVRLYDAGNTQIREYALDLK